MARLTRAETQARTREKLLTSGGRLFAKKGFQAVSVEEIAARAGFTRGAFYANFADKADLFITLLEESRRTDMNRLVDLLAEAPDDQKLGAMQRWFDALVADGKWDLAYSELWPLAVRDPQLRARVAARQAEVRDVIARSIADYCAGAGISLPLSADHVAELMLAIAEGIATQRHLDPTALPSDAFTTAIAYLWFGLIAGDPGASVRDGP